MLSTNPLRTREVGDCFNGGQGAWGKENKGVGIVGGLTQNWSSGDLGFLLALP